MIPEIYSNLVDDEENREYAAHDTHDIIELGHKVNIRDVVDCPIDKFIIISRLAIECLLGAL